MGNAAMRCLLHGSPMVRVMRTDGKIVEYDEPIPASKVLRQHPNHLLVHCAPVEKKCGDSGQRRSKLTIMRADQTLALGEAFLLYPIPSQHKNSLQISQCCSLTEDSDEDRRSVRVRFRGLALRFRNQRKQLLMLNKGARKVGDTNDGAALLAISTPTLSFQSVESDSEDFSATFDESGQRIRPVEPVLGRTA